MTGVIAREKVNTGRQFEVDLARVLAIVTMVVVHTFEAFDVSGVVGGLWGHIIEFSGGPLSAPIFMTAMGVGMAYAHRQDAGTYARRGVTLVGQGYLLNILRGVLPLLLAYLLWGGAESLTLAVNRLIELDILQFAGLSFLLFALLRRFGAKDAHIVLVSVLMLAIATFIPPIIGEGMLGYGLFGAFFYCEGVEAFPLFSWFVFPAAGYGFGRLLERVSNKGIFYARLLAISSAAFIAYSVVLVWLQVDLLKFFEGGLYYRQELLRAPWVLLIACMLYSLLYFLSLLLRGEGIRSLMKFISGKVNDIYMAQWVMILWTRYIFLRGIAITPWMFWTLSAVITCLSVLYAWARTRAKKSRAR